MTNKPTWETRFRDKFTNVMGKGSIYGEERFLSTDDPRDIENFIDDLLAEQRKEIIKEDIMKTDKNRVIEANFIVRATLPSNRFADGWGNCSRGEGGKAHPNHDIPATACTRATNRAIADLIGAGEVSADEL